MGVVENYEQIAKKTVVIVGVGGVGSVTSEMLTRVGVGKLILFDYDKVEIANMNRLFYTPNQVGLTKVEAAKLTLEGINPNTKIVAYNGDITVGETHESLLKSITEGGLNGERCDLVLSCVDNYAARMAINTACNELDQIWIESGVSEDALSCHFQIIVPGETACFACVPPLAMAENNEANIKREGVCAASLPTTMGITAGFMAHTAMKVLLEFEDVQAYLQYNARSETFSSNGLVPNPECLDKKCCALQQKKKGQETFLEKRKAVIDAKKEANKPVYDFENEWGIELVEEDDEIKEVESKNGQVDAEKMKNQDVGSLMDQLKGL